jgi:hypothetical protein
LTNLLRSSEQPSPTSGRSCTKVEAIKHNQNEMKKWRARKDSNL